MADPLRYNDLVQAEESSVGVDRQAESPFEDSLKKGEMNPNRQLPESGNPKLNRTAEQIGGTLGKAVIQARRAPDSAKQRLQIVKKRVREAGANASDQVSGSASSLAGNAQQRARNLSNRAQQRAGELMDAAEVRGRALLDKADEIRNQISQRGDELKQQLDDRTHELQQAARLRLEQARLRGERLVRERPLHVLAAIGAAGFILGVSLRIVRSRNASRY